MFKQFAFPALAAVFMVPVLGHSQEEKGPPPEVEDPCQLAVPWTKTFSGGEVEPDEEILAVYGPDWVSCEDFIFVTDF